MPKEYMLGNKFAVGAKPNKTAFGKGHEPWNKNLKGIHLSPGSQFKKGQKPVNTCAVVTELIRNNKKDNGRVYVKIAEPNVWKLRAVHVWESANGGVPKGSIVHHKDRNVTNDRLDNLCVMTRAEHLSEHREYIRECYTQKMIANRRIKDAQAQYRMDFSEIGVNS